MDIFPYTIIYEKSGDSIFAVSTIAELWRTDKNGKHIESIARSTPSVIEDKFNRLHIEHYGTPANYTKGTFPKERIRKMDVPWDMIDKIRKPK
jgi:hypothetical protein